MLLDRVWAVVVALLLFEEERRGLAAARDDVLVDDVDGRVLGDAATGEAMVCCPAWIIKSHPKREREFRGRGKWSACMNSRWRVKTKQEGGQNVSKSVLESV